MHEQHIWVGHGKEGGIIGLQRGRWASFQNYGSLRANYDIITGQSAHSQPLLRHIL